MEPSRITGIYRNAVRLFAAMKSENIGGLVSMAGSCLFLLGGDSAGIVIALSFLVAEIILTRYGHTRAGYSAGGLFFSFGDALAVISVVASGNKGFQVTLALMAGAWLIGAARAPIAWLGERCGSAAIVAAADALQPIVGIATLVLRIPGIVTGPCRRQLYRLLGRGRRSRRALTGRGAQIFHPEQAGRSLRLTAGSMSATIRPSSSWF